MSDSNEKRRYHIDQMVIDGERFIQVLVRDEDAQLITRDHFAVDEARALAAELVLAVEG